MATTLFDKYYNNPNKQFITTNMTCNGDSANETEFSITGDAATIATSSGNLASLPLGDVASGVYEWKTESRVIEPYSFTYVKGTYEGMAYQRMAYGEIPECFMDLDDFKYNIGLRFNLFYYQNGCGKQLNIDAHGDYDEDVDAFTLIQETFDSYNVPITISIENNEIVFTSTVLGYEYYMSTDFHTNTIQFYVSPDCPIGKNTDITLFLNEKTYVASKKYKNGAFKGVIIVPTYPQYNDSEISDEQRSLMVCHIRDRVNQYYPVDLGHGDTLFDKYMVEICDSYNDIAEIEKYNKWRYIDTMKHDDDKNWNEWYEKPDHNPMWTHAELIKNKEQMALGEPNKLITGLYGFINWAHYNNAWQNIGPIYMVVTSPDLVDSNYKNLLSSFVIFNPNPYPVKVNTMTFV